MAKAARLRDPSLGEWACLGILYDQPAHGWAIVKQLRPEGDIGRIWHLSRPLTYRALDQLTSRGWIHPVGEEPGDAGPNRTILAATRTGRARFRTWLRTPVPHLRDLRSELLLKLVFADQHHIEIDQMLDRQRDIIEGQAHTLTGTADDDHHDDHHDDHDDDDHDDDVDLDHDDDHADDHADDVDHDHDVVALWRIEATHAARRFLDQVHPADDRHRQTSPS